jgi:transposase
MPKHSRLPVEERVEAVLALLRKEEPAAVLARRYQVSEQTLYRWRDEFIEAGRSRLAKKEGGATEDARRITEMEKELDRRAQAIGELTIANGILRKLPTYPR